MRKGFYVFDMLMVLVVVVTIVHALVDNKYWEALFITVPLLMRCNTSILLYRKERWSILPIVVFTVLFGILYTKGILVNAILRTSELPTILLGKTNELGRYNYAGTLSTQDFICLNTFLLLIFVFVWIWIAPIVSYGFLAIRRKLVSNDYRWYDIAFLAMFKNRIG